MSAITGFTYTQQTRKKMEDGRIVTTQTITCGNGSLTYPANGVPLNAGAMGMPYGQIDAFDILDQSGAGAGDGYIYKWDNTHGTVRMYQAPTGTGPLLEVSTSATPTVSLVVMAIGY